MATDTIIHRFLNQSKLRPKAPAYHVKKAGGWQATSWQSYNDEVRQAARALLTLGLGRRHDSGEGDASCVCILGFNRPEWAIMDFAAMTAGGVPAGIYTTCSAAEVAYIVGHTDARLVLVEDGDQLAKLTSTKGDLPALETVVLMHGAGDIDAHRSGNDTDLNILSWEEFLAKAEETSEDTLQGHIDSLDGKALATLIYTSGTTGPPKGVMLSHDSLAWTAQAAANMIENGASDCSVSYLPLSHIAEQMFTLHGPATTGSQVYFAESIDKVADNFKEVQPTVLFAVPRIWEKFYAGVTSKLAQAPKAKKFLLGIAREVGTEVNTLRNRGEEPSGWLAMKYSFFNKKVFGALKEALGLGRAKVCVSGAAPINPEIIRFFSSLDIVIREVYGQSEDCGPTSFNLPGRTRFGSVGPAVDGVEVKIATDDEILVRGPNVFMGYYKDQGATDATLIDGWLHSGDLGKIDSEGFLHITGRKKDIIITAGGKNIAPKNIEAALKEHLAVGEAVVIGDRRKYLSALISLDAEQIEAYCQEHGIPSDAPHESSKLRDSLQRHVDDVNRDLARVEQIKKFHVLATPFSIEGGELTPTLKVKRKVVNENFSKEIDALYE
jgi:long-chain acyl-CoA synthetase